MNESAFPWSVDDGLNIKGQKGMTLRDYFAAQAMKPLIENFLRNDLHLQENDWMGGLSMDAYSMADAMMKVRKA